MYIYIYNQFISTHKIIEFTQNDLGQRDIIKNQNNNQKRYRYDTFCHYDEISKISLKHKNQHM